MKLLGALAAALCLVGRHGTLVAAASIFVGLAVPGLAASFKPYLGEAIVVMLTLAFLRVDPAELRRYWTRPGLIAAATVWAMLVVPTLVGCVFLAVRSRSTHAGTIFHAGAADVRTGPDVVARPRRAIRARRRADAREPGCVGAITPFTASLFTHMFSRHRTRLPAWLRHQVIPDHRRLRARCDVIRLVTGKIFIEAQRERIDGLSVLAMFMFAVAAMDGVTEHFRTDPTPGH